MKRRVSICLLLAFLFLSPGYTSRSAGEEAGARGVRPSILAGTWYPGNRDRLINTIGEALSGAEAEPLQGELMAVLVPHAGYIYSGRVAAFAYRLLRGKPFNRVIMIGPSHRVAFKGVSINLQEGYQTPLGTVPVDRDLARRIMGAGPDIGWIPRAHAREHSLEIQLPFLQSVLGDFRIVPVLIWERDLKTCYNLARSLVRSLEPGHNTLLLASSDLSHFHDSRRARSLDMEFIKHVRGFDPEGLASSLASGSCEACGGGPAVAAMLAAREMGADRAVVLNYAHSGDVTGDHKQVVGYVSAAFVKAN
jgi:AmmeMemoRadiSam system protein B